MREPLRTPALVNERTAHTCSLTVRSYECDAYGHLNNAIYLHYLEFARPESIRANGISFADLRAAGYALLVAKVSIEYRRLAVTDDFLRMDTVPTRRSIVGGVLRRVITRAEPRSADGAAPAVVAEADVTWVRVDSTGRPARLPPAFDREGLAP